MQRPGCRGSRGSQPPCLWRGKVREAEVHTKDRRTVVGFVSLHEAPAIDVYNLAPPSIVAAEHVEAADHLAKTITNFGSPQLLLVCQMGDEPREYEPR
jgi:hypothetical protein